MFCQVDPPYVHKQMVDAYYQSSDVWRTESCSRVFLAMIPEKTPFSALHTMESPHVVQIIFMERLYNIFRLTLCEYY